tara:strand:+ start:508 stop:1800 length:1293 start_codon:yes stop_codon:yes gene_type:complete
MATLNEIAYNIKNLAYGGNAPKEVNISIKQIKHWIHYHRAKLIADNIDKGIMSNHVLWQELKLDIHNYNNASVRLYDRLWDIYWSEFNQTGTPVTAPTTADLDPQSGQTPYDVDFLDVLPKTTDGDFSGYWISGPNTMSGISDHDRLMGKENRNQYGLTTPSSQLRGDFRNIGSAEFIIPELLMLKNHGSIKDVSLRRMVYHSDDVNYGDMEPSIDNQNGPQHDFIHLPMKTIDESSYSDFNRFSTSNKPHAILKRTNTTQRASLDPLFLSGSGSDYINNTYLDGFNDGDGYIDASIMAGTLVLGLNGLQVSPSYFMDNDTPPENKIRWAYDGNLRAIFSDPTETVSFRKFDSSLSSSPLLENNPSHFSRHAASWDDDKSPYPIPTEYIKDLIDRVIATEVSISTKVISDELRDNVDTTKVMQYGAKVQG